MIRIAVPASRSYEVLIAPGCSPALERYAAKYAPRSAQCL